MSEHKNDPELRRALLSKVPFSSTSSIRYTPELYLSKVKDEAGNDTDEYELPEEFRPIFKLRCFSKKDVEEQSKSSKDISPSDSVKRMVEYARRNVVGWSNLYDAGVEEGEDLREIEFKASTDGGCDKDLFDTIPIFVISDLYAYITSISGIRLLDRSGL